MNKEIKFILIQKREGNKKINPEMGVVCCAECEEQELIEAQREQYLHDVRWQENMNHLYTWDEGGFCDGFTNQ